MDSTFEIETTGKTALLRHFCRYPARRAAARNSNLPAKPLSHGTFAGTPRAAMLRLDSDLPAKPLPRLTFAGIPRASSLAAKLTAPLL
jgi:hypothetical protein